MGLLLRILGIGKALARGLGWQGIVILLVVGLIFGLYVRGNLANRKIAERDREIAQLELQLAVKGAEADSLKGLGRYPKPDTSWLPGKLVFVRHDSLHIDTVHCPPIPSVVGHVRFDTTKYFGEGSNPFSVRVYGDFYTPEELAYRNRLLIVPSFHEKPPQSTYRPRSQTGWAIGLGILTSLNGAKANASALAFVRASRMLLIANYDINMKSWQIGLGCELIRF